MKTSIQKQFDILMVAAATGVSKLEALALVKGWTLKTISAEKAEEVKNAVAKITAKRSTKLRMAGKPARRNGRKNATAPRFVGRLVVAVKVTTVNLTAQVRAVKAQVRATKVALACYVKALEVATKAASKLKEVKSKTVGWSESLLRAMGKAAQAVDAVATAKAAI